VKVLITGGTGFVGPHVVRAVADQGHDLKLLVRDSIYRASRSSAR
jgi:uncharacterized protein YbjT (DUF2867 family)